MFALKGSQGLFYEEIRGYFEESVLEKLKGEEVCYKKTVEPEHGEAQFGNTISQRMRAGTVNGKSGKSSRVSEWSIRGQHQKWCCGA